MKKNKLMGLLLVACINSSAFADLQVIWSGLDGFVRADGSTPILDGGGANAYLAQLLWTPDAFIAPASVGGAVGPGSNEVILQTHVVTHAAAGDFGLLFSQNFAGAFPGAGFVYARVFDVGSDNTANIVEGMDYYAGPLLAAVDESDPSINQFYNIHSGSGPFEPSFQTDELNLQVVPEPSVFALLGIGGLMLALRRRFRK